MVKRGIEKLYLGLIMLFLYAPILTLIVFSFNDSNQEPNGAALL